MKKRIVLELQEVETTKCEGCFFDKKIQCANVVECDFKKIWVEVTENENKLKYLQK